MWKLLKIPLAPSPLKEQIVPKMALCSSLLIENLSRLNADALKFIRKYYFTSTEMRGFCS